MKKTYMTPQVEAAELQGETVMLQMSGGDTKIGWGGNVSKMENAPTEADVNGNGNWDIW